MGPPRHAPQPAPVAGGALSAPAQHHLAALAGVAVVLVAMGLPWVAATFFAEAQGQLQGVAHLTLGGRTAFALPTNAPPDLADRVAEMRGWLAAAHLGMALGLAVSLHAALRLRYLRAGVGVLGSGLAGFLALMTVDGRLPPEVQTSVALLPGGAGLLLGGTLLLAAWASARRAGVRPVKRAWWRRRRATDPPAGPRWTPERVLALGAIGAFALAGFTLRFPAPGAALVVGAALATAAVAALPSGPSSRAPGTLLRVALPALALGHLAVLLHLPWVGAPALLATLPLASVLLAGRVATRGTAASARSARHAGRGAGASRRWPGSPAAVAVVALLLLASLGAASLRPLDDADLAQHAVLAAGAPPPTLADPRPLLFQPDLEEGRLVLRAFERSEDAMPEADGLPVREGAARTFALMPRLTRPLPLEPGAPAMVVWRMTFEAQPAGLTLRFRILDGPREVGAAEVDLPPAAGQVLPLAGEPMPAVAYAEVPLAVDAFHENVALEVTVQGGLHLGGVHHFQDSGLLLTTPPGFAPAA